MPSQRVFLVFALLFVGFLLWQQWQLDQMRPPPPDQEPAATEAEPPDTSAPPAQDVPEVRDSEVPALETGAEAEVAAVPEAPASATVTVTTDVVRAVLDTRGGTVRSVELLQYPRETGGDEPVELLYERRNELYIAQSGLQATGDAAAPDHRAQYTAAQNDYRLGQADAVEVPLVWEGDGVRVTKTLVFEAGSYMVSVIHRVANAGAGPWRGRQYRQLQRTEPELENGGFTNPERFSYVGAAWYGPEERYTKLSFDDMREEGPLDVEVAGGWVAQVQHYFVSAWVPESDESNRFYSRVLGSGEDARYLIGATSPFQVVAPGETAEFRSVLFSGPKLQDVLPKVAPGLELTVDYGIFTVISQPLFWLLEVIHDGVGNWGWAIIILTLLIKLVFYKLSETQYRSMARMRKMQPRLQSLKERYGDDRQKLQQATMELYREEKVNPLGGCLPILVQIPVFIALYWVLLESVELRQAPFMLWLQDLSAPDPYFILPVIMGASMLVQQKLTPAPSADPVQQKIMMILPVVFTVMFAFFQSGLVLYWTTNQLLSLAQQWVITRRVEKGETGKR